MQAQVAVTGCSDLRGRCHNSTPKLEETKRETRIITSPPDDGQVKAMLNFRAWGSDSCVTLRHLVAISLSGDHLESDGEDPVVLTLLPTPANM